MSTEGMRAYYKHIIDTYDRRSENHDKSEGHRSTSLKLVDELPPCSGDRVLDIATGTGTIAFYVASLIEPNGNVIGVDLSEGMLTKAKEKLHVSSHQNIDFILADAENLNFAENSFDRIYCASAFFCILDPLSTLRHWYDLLKPGGVLGFHALPETSYFWVSIARDVLANYDIPYILNTPTGTIEKTRKLLIEAGFKEIDIRENKTGYYVPLEEAKKTWIQKDDFAPGQHPHPVNDVPSEIMIQCQRDYETKIEELCTDKGVWNDTSMYYIYAQK